MWAWQRVYCGHEYTLQNLSYGLHVEPGNEEARPRLAWAPQRRRDQQPTVPSLMADEKRINPFMRTDQPAVQRHTGHTDPIAVMRSLRAEKDHFKAK